MDFSCSLRHELYEKDSLVQRLCLKLREQGQVSQRKRSWSVASQFVLQLFWKESEDNYQQYKLLYNEVVNTAHQKFDKQASDMQALLMLQETEMKALREEIEVLCVFDGERGYCSHLHQAQSKEHSRLEAQTQHERELATERYTEELVKIRNQFEVCTDKQIHLHCAN